MKLTSSFLSLALALLTPVVIATPEPQSGLPEVVNNLKPLVNSNLLQLLVLEPSLLNHANQFAKFAADGGGTRAFGSPGHNATVAYIKRQLDRTGYYDTELQTFPYLFSQGSATFSVDGRDVPTAWFTYGPGGNVEQPLVLVNNLGCTPEDYPAEVAGKIALISRGSCEFGLKTALAGAAGAAGAIIYNNAPGAVGGGTLGAVSRPDGPYVPVSSITGDEGEALKAAILGGAKIVGKLDVTAVTEDRWSSNLFATTKFGDKNNIVFAGGHSDSVPAGPGINDDGSGTMSILEIALRLPFFKVNNAVRFGFWTAEEFGLVGSEHYISNLPQEERDKIALYLNFDMVASPNFGYFIYDGDGSAFGLTGPPGSDHIEKTFEDFFKSKRLRSAPTEFSGRSDYGPFLDVGIPAGGLFTGAEGVKTAEEATWWGGEAGVAYDACYHQACDGVNNLHRQAWLQNTRAAAHSIATYARSLDGIPRSRRSVSAEARVAQLNHEERRHYACGHKISYD